MTEDTDSESELSAEELGEVAGGSFISDALEAAKKAAVAKKKEIIRSSGGTLGSSTSPESFKPL